jgi:hypothetical protein
MSDTQTIERPDAKTDDGSGTDEGELFHYVKASEIAESSVTGRHVVALCGEVFPVTRVPKDGAPICGECKRILAKKKP